MQHSDPLTTICETFEDFLKSIKDKEITTVIQTWRGEWAPRTEEPGVNHGEVLFGSLQEVTLLGYHGATGTIIRFTARDAAADRPRFRGALQAAGLTVEERCRNIT